VLYCYSFSTRALDIRVFPNATSGLLNSGEMAEGALWITGYGCSANDLRALQKIKISGLARYPKHYSG
jgi:hypothetical protein